MRRRSGTNLAVHFELAAAYSFLGSDTSPRLLRRGACSSGACLAEVSTRGTDSPADTGLDFAHEEGRVIEFWAPGSAADDA
jgi:hypothetical protein